MLLKGNAYVFDRVEGEEKTHSEEYVQKERTNSNDKKYIKKRKNERRKEGRWEGRNEGRKKERG